MNSTNNSINNFISKTGATNRDYFILDTKRKEKKFKDVDFKSYEYDTMHNNKLEPNAVFLYRKHSKDGKFVIYGGGKISSISKPKGSTKATASITNGFKFSPPIKQGDKFIETFKWNSKVKGKDWRNFWTQYGITKINKEDFFGLAKHQNCIKP